MSGKKLIPELVKKARREELGEVAKHGVYKKVPLEECWKKKHGTRPNRNPLG